MSRLLVFNFDGTGNEPRDADQGVSSDQFKDESISNILKLHLMLGGNLYSDSDLRGHCLQSRIHRCFYYQGVGTYGNWLSKLINQGLAPQSADVTSILNRAIEDFCQHYQQGDTLLVTGFSRGAAIARCFVTLIQSNVDKNTDAFVYLCVFDTVASMGLPDLSTHNRPRFDVVFEHGHKLADIVKKALHLVSLDEKRKAFQPTLMNHEANKVLELWFAGAHSNIGGGYYHDALSDVCLNFAMQWLNHNQAYHCLAHFNLRVPTQSQLQSLCPDALQQTIQIDDLFCTPNPLGKSHQQSRNSVLEWISLDDRRCCVIENEQISHQLKPLVHHSVATRIAKLPDYQPASLNSVEHQLWHNFTTAPQRFADGLAHKTLEIESDIMSE